MASELYNNYSAVCDTKHPLYDPKVCPSDKVPSDDSTPIPFNQGGRQCITNAVALAGVGLTYTLPAIADSVRPNVISELGGDESTNKEINPSSLLTGSKEQQQQRKDQPDSFLNMPTGPNQVITPLTYIEASKQAIDKKTPINIVTANKKATSSNIKNSILNQPSNFSTTKAKTMREAINRGPAEENAVIFLFDYLGFKYNTTITLAELILLGAGFDRTLPIGTVTLPLIAPSLPSPITFNVGPIYLGISGVEPTTSILTVS
jgi:hypothetical protein